MSLRRVGISIVLVLGAALWAGCQSNLALAPPVSPAFIRAGVRENADERTLAQGRTLFLNRCIQCHALPEVARFDASRLPAIVAKMSGRANLSPKQHEAVLKYLLTVRSQSL
jgi:mono/diheme cytochrome c family protein